MVLSQEENPICYISTTLNKAEENYSTTEKELLAIVWSVQLLRQYLLGREFQIRTDHQTLTWLFKCKDPSSRLLRGRLRLEGYDYVIEYCKGKDNKAVDALYRVLPIQNEEPAMAQQQNSAEAIAINAETTTEGLNDSEAIELSTTPNSPAGSHVIIEPPFMNAVDEDLNIPLHERFMEWQKKKTGNQATLRPNAEGKLWVKLYKTPSRVPRNFSSQDYILLPPFGKFILQTFLFEEEIDPAYSFVMFLELF